MQSLAEYRTAAEDIIAALTSRARGIASCLLHGSVARRSIRPHKSDLLDAVVVFQDDILRSEHEFYHALEAMISACDRLKAFPCPTHPFHYYTCWEVTNHFPASLLSIYRSDDHSECAYGEDLRGQMETSSSSRKVSQMLCLTFMRSAQGLAQYLSKRRLERHEVSLVLKQLVRYRKTVPLLACIGYGRWVEHQEADIVIRSLMPDLDFSPFEKLDLLIVSWDEVRPPALRTVLKDTLVLLGNMHEQLWADLV